MAKFGNPPKQTQKAKAVEQTQSASRYAVSKYLEGLKFSPRVMGVDEADVWKKIEKLCELYEAALTEERGKSEKLARQLKTVTVKLKAYVKAEKREEDRPDGE